MGTMWKVLITIICLVLLAAPSSFAGCARTEQTPKLAATVTTVTSSLNPSRGGSRVTFTVTVTPTTGSGTPTGTVTLKDGDNTVGTAALASGQATFDTSALAIGTHIITAVYGGDANFGASSSAVLVETVSTKVPTPEPVQSDYLVGAYYWISWDRSRVLSHFMDWNDRIFEPLLGTYDSTDTEVVNWHIKWAVEHGISFLAVQFYESQLKAGFMRADYLPYIKFGFIAPVELGVVENETDIAIQIDWMSPYFGNSSYLKIDNRPVVFMLIRYNTDRSSVDENEKANLLEKIRKAKSYQGFLAVQPYLVGVYTINTGDWNLTIPELSQEFDAVTLYNAGLAGGDTPYGTYDTMVSGYTSLWSQWDQASREISVPIVPSAIPGFDDTLSYEHKTREWVIARAGASPGKFKQMLDGVKNYTNGELGMVLITAWNEFAEGSVIEPTKNDGFAYLDAVRDTFTDSPPGGYPPDIIPPDDQ